LSEGLLAEGPVDVPALALLLGDGVDAGRPAAGAGGHGDGGWAGGEGGPDLVLRQIDLCV